MNLRMCKSGNTNWIILLLLSFVLVAGSVTRTKATHIIGGELIYQCLFYDTATGNGYYRFTVKLYRDCTGGNATYDSTIYVSIYDVNESLINPFDMDLPPTDTLSNNTYNLCLVSPTNVCVEEAIYQGDFFLGPGEYYMTYQRCCRNESIVNLPNPLGIGASWYLTIPDSSKAACNSSAYFTNYPPTIICLDWEFEYDHSATDTDGDSLVYYLCPATTDDFIDPITSQYSAVIEPADPPSDFFDVPYITPTYSAQYPIWAPTDPFEIDSFTGWLTGTPTQVGQYVVAVCVDEYRNAQWLNTNKRDFQFNVAECIEDVSSSFYSPAMICDSLEVTFFSDSSIHATFFTWDFGEPVISTDTSSIANPSYAYSDSGTYQVTLIVNEDYACADTTIKSVYVFSSPIVDATIIDEGDDVGDDIYITLGESVILLAQGTVTALSWSPGSSLSDSTVSNPTAKPAETTTYIVTNTSAEGCTDRDTLIVRVVDPAIAIPNAFTPNGDGVNDTLYIIEVGIKKLVELRVFNRYGQVVFKTEDLAQGWDGSYKGEPQEIGNYVYYYIAESLSGDMLEGKGDIALLR